MASPRTCLALAVVVASCVVSASVAAKQAAVVDNLSRAKDLYASAEYEQALTILNAADLAAGGVEVDQYRALCLLALGRNDDALQVIQRIVEKNPLFEPPPTQVSPRVQTTFRDVRKRMLPAIVRQTYAEGKAAFDVGEMDNAKARFERVLAEIDALESLGSKEFVDLRLLAKGFVDLISRSAAPPPAPASTPAPAKRVEAPPPPSNVIHTVGESGVTPPVVISQVMPPWRPSRQDTRNYEAVVSIIIDETGAVTDLNIDGMLQPAYEAALRRAAPSWRFRPATLKGVPVKYRKNVAVRLTSDQTP
jgi:tetratricopeptide (TPR) repeat protein